MPSTGVPSMIPSMQNPRNLDVWHCALDLAALAYEVTKHLPADERFGLTSQMTRAAVSIGSNIAEGCGRDGDREYLRFLHNAMGSAGELQFQLEVVKRLQLVPEDGLIAFEKTLGQTRAMLSRLILSIRRRSESLADERPKRVSR